MQTLHDEYSEYMPLIMSLCWRRDSDGTTVSSVAADKSVATEWLAFPSRCVILAVS
jgi:hypothetical protein